MLRKCMRVALGDYSHDGRWTLMVISALIKMQNLYIQEPKVIPQKYFP